MELSLLKLIFPLAMMYWSVNILRDYLRTKKTQDLKDQLEIEYLRGVIGCTKSEAEIIRKELYMHIIPYLDNVKYIDGRYVFIHKGGLTGSFVLNEQNQLIEIVYNETILFRK